MANVSVGGPGTFNALLYPEQNPINVAYFQDAVSNINQNLTNVGQQFMEGAQNLFERFNSAEALQAARAAIRAAQGIFHPNTIYEMQTLNQLQAAQPVMQRWIMAEPTVRELYHNQQCEGYGETYNDLYPDTVGEDHYDYRRVMDGVIQDTDDGWKATFYMDDLVEGDRELLHDEKTDIIHTWDLAKMFVKAGVDDPTDPFGGTL